MMGVAAVALASCTQTEVFETSPSNVDQREISFENYIGNPTKAAAGVITTENLTSFQVFGGYGDNLTNVYNDAAITKDGEVWRQVGNPKYWVAGETYNFAAYAPAGVGTSTVNKDNANLDFTNVTVNAANQNDFIYATKGGITPEENQNPGPVALNFKHKLAMVKISIGSGFGQGYQIAISNLNIKGMNSTGNYSGAADAWTVQESKDENGFITVSATATADAAAVSDEWIVLPQTLATDAVTITFRAVVTAVNAPDDVIGSHNFTATLSGEWEMANRYNYTVTLDADDFEGGDGTDPENPEQDIYEITFTPEVEAWTDSWTDSGITVE